VHLDRIQEHLDVFIVRPDDALAPGFFASIVKTGVD